jgi:hypothetical protein
MERRMVGLPTDDRRLLVDLQALGDRHSPQDQPQVFALYVAESQFKYNNRQNADIFGAAIVGC